MRLNLVFHNITKNNLKFDNKYTVNVEYFIELINKIKRSISRNICRFNDFEIYFDDGYNSFYDLIFPIFRNQLHKIKLALIIEKINQKGYLNDYEIEKIIKNGVQIVSHGVSHSALTVYKNDHLQPTPLGGDYKNTPRGKNETLYSNQVLYQLIESKNTLEKKFKIKCDEFVFPYGLYNDNIIALNNKYRIYQTMSTCDEYLDKDYAIKPRILIDNEKTVQDTINFLNNLSGLN